MADIGMRDILTSYSQHVAFDDYAKLIKGNQDVTLSFMHKSYK